MQRRFYSVSIAVRNIDLIVWRLEQYFVPFRLPPQPLYFSTFIQGNKNVYNISGRLLLSLDLSLIYKRRMRLKIHLSLGLS